MSKPADCMWPWHNDKDCPTCVEHEVLYGLNLDQYLKEVSEQRVRARASRRRKGDPVGEGPTGQ